MQVSIPKWFYSMLVANNLAAVTLWVEFILKQKEWPMVLFSLVYLAFALFPIIFVFKPKPKGTQPNKGNTTKTNNPVFKAMIIQTRHKKGNCQQTSKETEDKNNVPTV